MEFFDFLTPINLQRKPSKFKFSFRAKIATLWVVAGIMLLFLLRFSHIIPVFVWAGVTAYLFNPVITFLSEKTKLSKAVWIIFLYIFLGLLAYWSFTSLAPLISNEVSDLVSGSLDDPSTFLGRIASQGPISILGFDISLKNQVIIFSEWLKTQIPTQFFPIFFGAVEKLVFLLIYLVVTFYFILDSSKYIILLKRIIPLPYRQEIFDLLEDINLTLGAYIRAQVVLIFIMSAASFVALSILRIKYALMLSLATGLLEVIPIAGPIVATAVASTVALFQITTPYGLSNATLTIIVIAVYFALRQFEDYFIIPNVVSKFVKVHPVVAILALLVGGTVGGVLGLFLAIPTAAIIIVFLEYLYKKLTEED